MLLMILFKVQLKPFLFKMNYFQVDNPGGSICPSVSTPTLSTHASYHMVKLWFNTAYINCRSEIQHTLRSAAWKSDAPRVHPSLPLHTLQRAT